MQKTTDFMKKAYRDYFGVKLGDHDKPFTPTFAVKHVRRTSGIGEW